jgi:hypothetical protein
LTSWTTLGEISGWRAADPATNRCNSVSKTDDAELIRLVTERINDAIQKNPHTERLYVAGLVLLFLAGLALLIVGAITQRWELLAPGGLVQLAIIFPIRKLIQLRQDDMRLQIIPQLLLLAETRESKALAAKLVKRLIEKV